MSKIQHDDAMFPGYRGPYFPGSINDLQEALQRSNKVTNHWLGNVARSIGGASSSHGRTTDDYTWFSQIKSPFRAATILIPWSQDWNKSDDTQADRSAALYVRRGTLASADRFVWHFVHAVLQQIKEDEEASKLQHRG